MNTERLGQFFVDFLSVSMLCFAAELAGFDESPATASKAGITDGSPRRPKARAALDRNPGSLSARSETHIALTSGLPWPYRPKIPIAVDRVPGGTPYVTRVRATSTARAESTPPRALKAVFATRFRADG
jgi:hypothetical protein